MDSSAAPPPPAGGSGHAHQGGGSTGGGGGNRRDGDGDKNGEDDDTRRDQDDGDDGTRRDQDDQDDATPRDQDDDTRRDQDDEDDATRRNQDDEDDAPPPKADAPDAAGPRPDASGPGKTKGGETEPTGRQPDEELGKGTTEIPNRGTQNPLDSVNDTVKQHFETWPKKVQNAYIQAQQRLQDAQLLARRMSEAEYQSIFGSGRGTVDDVFIPGTEGNRVFSLDRIYEFSDSVRNTRPGAYDREVLIPITDELKQFLSKDLVPDNVPGGLPNELKGNPRFKFERGDYNIVIPKSIWDDFRKLITDGS
jgi:hypothetical protein